MYYIYIEDGKINGCGECAQLNDEVINYEVSEKLFNDFSQNPLKYTWNGLSVISNPDYEKLVRLNEIEQELAKAEDVYKVQLNTPVEFTNTHLYKPIWVDDGTYTKLITGLQAGVITFPQTIWDSTELEENAVEMEQEEFMQLCMFLSVKQQEFFNARKALKSQLLEEKQEIRNSLDEN